MKYSEIASNKLMKVFLQDFKKRELDIFIPGLHEPAAWRVFQRNTDHVAFIVRFGKIIGDIHFKVLSRQGVESGMLNYIDVLLSYRNKGYGSRALRQLCQTVADRTGVKNFVFEAISKQSYRCLMKAFPQTVPCSTIGDLTRISDEAKRLTLVDSADELQDTAKHSRDHDYETKRLMLWFSV